jgi:predicted nucleic acid-binding protein
MERTLHGYRQVTDAYLLALAARRQGTLASFERGLRALAATSLAAALDVVPTR